MDLDCQENYRNISDIKVCHLPMTSTTRRVSTTGSITSSGMCIILLFCKFKVSREFKFSKPKAGRALILKGN